MKTTWGVLDPPVGNTRLNVVRLVASLLQSNTHSINTELISLNTLGVILVSTTCIGFLFSLLTAVKVFDLRLYYIFSALLFSIFYFLSSTGPDIHYKYTEHVNKNAHIRRHLIQHRSRMIHNISAP